MKKAQNLIFTIFLITMLTMGTYAQQQQFDPAMLYVNEFQTAMSTMFPTQRFTFDLLPGEEQTISLWPQADIEKVVIAFYTHNQQEPALVTGSGFFASCDLSGVRMNSFDHQKLGACTLEITSRPSFINLNFRSQETPLTVYVQYQLIKIEIQTIPNQQVNQNVPTQQQQKKSKLQQISKKFQKVKKRTQLQQGALRLLTRSLNKHNTRFQKNMKYAYHRLMIETVLVVTSGLLGLWIIKKQFNKGYQLLV